MQLEHTQATANQHIDRHIVQIHHSIESIRSIISGMVFYEGHWTAAGAGEVFVNIGAIAKHRLNGYNHVKDYTDKGTWFSWGKSDTLFYKEGCQQLALAVCRHILGVDEWAEQVHEKFYEEVILKLPQQDFTLRYAEVWDLIEKQNKFV